MTVSFPEESAYPDVRDCGVSDIKVEDMSWNLDCFAPVRKDASSHWSIAVLAGISSRIS